MLPGAEIKTINVKQPLDGDQELKFYFVSLKAPVQTQILNWGNIINCSAEPSEITHKIWVKGQGDNTNQGASSAKTMMRHSQSKAAAQECAHAIAGICSKDHVLQS
jgi:hypothetical protein